MKKLKIWTDGSCLKNPGPGGWAYSIVDNEDIADMAGGVPQSTNNRMELSAAIEALQSLDHPCEVDLYTDSKYVQLGITTWIHGWIKRSWRTSAGKEVLNIDLWKDLLSAADKHTVRWHWVKGHGVDVMNQRVDQLARMAAESMC